MEKQKSKLKMMRGAKGMKQVELAGRSGVSVSYLQALETGWIRPSEKIQSKLADALECKLKDIFAEKAEVYHE